MHTEKTKESAARPDIGGQAVLDGVMMKAPDAIAVAVRRKDGSIVIRRDSFRSPSERHSWMARPFIRGVVNLVLMLKMGMGVLKTSGEMSGALEEEPGRFEKWLAAKLGKKADQVVMGSAAVLAVFLSLGLFVLLPNIPVRALRESGWSLTAVNLVSGVIRILILLGYLILCGLIPDMRRTFQYHGSEHKTVYCHENNLLLTPHNAQGFSTLHPRCGTSFLLITFMLSILFYSITDSLIKAVTGFDMASHYLARVLSRLLLLPVVAGISYEALKALAHSNTPLARALRWPGLQMQRLTTRRPSDAMLEVAIAAMEAALHGLPEGPRTPEGYALLRNTDSAQGQTEGEPAAQTA